MWEASMKKRADARDEESREEGEEETRRVCADLAEGVVDAARYCSRRLVPYPPISTLPISVPHHTLLSVPSAYTLTPATLQYRSAPQYRAWRSRRVGG
eukprot:1966158-Rhodomonas_salina.1